MKKILTLFTALALSACVSVDNYSSKEALEKTKSALPAIEQGKASVCFVRQHRINGMGTKAAIYDTHEYIGKIGNDSFFCKNLTPGDHLFVAKFFGQDDAVAPIRLNSGARTYVNVSVDFYLGINEIPEGQALVIIGHALD